MNILVTGASGRVGRSIALKLMRSHAVRGVDTNPSSSVEFVGDIRDAALMRQALAGIDVLVHTAALHAPHVGVRPDADFKAINVAATGALARLALEAGVQHLVFTSTTALYGHASTSPDRAGWIDETVTPQPRTIYHRSKIAAEGRLETFSKETGLPVTVLQMSRCFPEPVNLMAVYRLNRGVDFRDVADAHAAAIEKRLPGFQRFIVSAATPFEPGDCEGLFTDAPAALRRRAPDLVQAFEERGWELPPSLDRVYTSARAREALDWTPRHGFQSVLNLYDQELPEVLPPTR
jgi:UDP-glucose 4-epimerase